MEITAFILWVVAAMLSYVVARNKGRDPIVAVAMSLLFGFFALIYYLIAKGSKEYEVKRAKELIHSSKHSEPEEGIKVEHNTSKKNETSSSGCLIVLIIFGGFIAIFVIGAIASALSNKSGSSSDYSLTGQINQTQPDYKSMKGYAFPEANRTAFKQSCVKEAGPELAGISQAYCSCLLKYFELNYSFKEFLNIEKQYLKTGKFPPDVVTAANNCVK